MTTHSPVGEPAGATAAHAADKSTEKPTQRDGELAGYDEFVDRVRKVCRDSPAAQAALRSGLGKTVLEVPARMHAALLRPGLIRHDIHHPGQSDKEQAYYTVAALIAARPRARRLADAPDAQTSAAHESGAQQGDAMSPTIPAQGGETGPGTAASSPAAVGVAFAPRGTSLGESFADAVGRRSPDQLKSGAAESRLHLLVRQDFDGVLRMLPGVLRWLGSSGVSPDYACLLRDVTMWRYRRDVVTTRWLQAFYRSLSRQEAAQEAAAEKSPALSDT